MIGYIVETAEIFGTIEVGKTYNRRNYRIYSKIGDAVDDYNPKFYRIYECEISGNELRIARELYKDEGKIKMSESDYIKLNHLLNAETDEEVLAALK